MHSSGSLGALVRPEPPTEISKGDFLRFLEDTLKKSEVSWATTDARSFEWDEINLNKSMFVKQLDSLRFKKAFVGIFDSSTKRMEYFAFIVK
jgi:hypothetical protein